MSDDMSQQTNNIDPRLLLLGETVGLEAVVGQHRTSQGSASGHRGGSMDQATAQTCMLCDKRFASKGGLQRHMRDQHSEHELLCPMHQCRRGRPGNGFKRKYMLVQHLGNAKANIKGSTGHGIAEHEADRVADEAVAAAKARLQVVATEQAAPLEEAALSLVEEDVDTVLNGMEPMEMLFGFENL